MIFVWSGLGFLVVPIVLVTSLAVSIALEFLLESIGYSELMSSAIAFGILASACVNWFVGRKLNSNPMRKLIDPATQEAVLLDRRHKFFWIPMQYWSFPVAAIGLLILFAGSGHAALVSRVEVLPNPMAQREDLQLRRCVAEPSFVTPTAMESSIAS